MKLQLLIYLLCFVAVASVSLRAEPTGPLFGGTVDGVFKAAFTVELTPDSAKISGISTPLCETPNCQKRPNADIQAIAAAVQP